MSILAWILAALIIGFFFSIFFDLFMMFFPYILVGSCVMFGVWLFSGDGTVDEKMQSIEQKADNFEQYLDKKFKPQQDVVITPSDGYTR